MTYYRGYYPSNRTLNNALVYSKRGRNFNGTIDDTFFIGRNKCGKWWITTLEDHFNQGHISHYVSSVNHLTTPPEHGWKLVEEMFAPPPKLSIVHDNDDEVSYLERIRNKVTVDTFNDIHFYCADGMILHSNKSFLSAVNPYFKIIFEGDWNEEHPDGIWQTSTSAETMEIILSFIHSLGKESDGVAKQPIQILALAHKYQLTNLINFVELMLIHQTGEENVKKHLQVSILHDLDRLKLFCMRFLQKHMYEAVMNEHFFLSLANEDNTIWDIMRFYLS